MTEYTLKSLLQPVVPTPLPDLLDATFEGPNNLSVEIFPGAFHFNLPDYAFITLIFKVDGDPIGILTSEVSETQRIKHLSMIVKDPQEFNRIKNGAPMHPHCPHCMIPIPLHLEWQGWLWKCPQCGTDNKDHPVWHNCVKNESKECTYSPGSLPCPYCGQEFDVQSLMKNE